MSAHPLELRFCGAQVLVGNRLSDQDIGVEAGHISDGVVPCVDVSGYLILPGIVDLHGDAFERHMAPRPSAPFPMNIGLVGTDRDAAANGVTTAWMAQSWSWEGGARGPEYACELLQAHEAFRDHMQTDLRIQLRVETHTMDSQAELLRAIERWQVDYVVFNNHLAEALEMSVQQPHQIHGWAAKAGRTADEHMDLVRSCKSRDAEVPRYLCNLATAFDSLGVRYGSHDDPDGATRERYSMIGAKICEFPTAMGAALVARTWDDPIIMGAPNVVRGGSQSGNVAAIELIREGACDALVSDYYYPALAQAAFKLADDGEMDFGTAWGMISSGPAAIAGLKDRGLLAEGMRADLVIVDAETRMIEGTIANGRFTHLCGRLATKITEKRPVQNAVAAA